MEKAAEGKKLGVSLPGLNQYDIIAPALARDMSTQKVFLQTASPEALERFVKVCAASGLTVSFTNNTRSENDAWGGWKGGLEMEQAAVGAINAHIGSMSSASISPDLSIWTQLLQWVFGPDGQPLGVSSFCCPTETCRHTKGGSNSMQLAAERSVLESPTAFASTRKLCKERSHGGHKT